MRNRILKLSIALIVIILFFTNTGMEAYAIVNTDKNINFKKITVEDGLSQTSIEYLFQDSRGYMWIGTTDGLNRYNGHEFKVFRYRENDVNSITANYISAIKEDGNGNIWVGTSKGLNKLNIYTNKIVSYVPGENGCNLSNYNITEILIDSNNDIYIATEDGLNKYDKEKDNFTRLFDSNEEESLSSQFVYSIEEDIYGDFWIGTDNGLNYVNRKTKKVEKYFKSETGLSDNFIFKLYADNKGYLWIGTYSGGLNRLNIKTKEMDVYKNNHNDKSSIPGNSIRYILRDSRDLVWVATDKGFSRFDEDTEKFITYESKVYNPQSIVSNNILSLAEDKSGTIWIGTYDGISLFNPENLFRNYKSDPFDENSLSEEMVSGVYEDDEGLLWVGTVHEGINVIDRRNNTVKRYKNDPEDSNSISNNNIREIVGIGNEIWFATEDGLNKFDKKTGKFTRYMSEESGNSLIYNDVRTLYIDSDGILWIGTRDGLCTFDRKEKFKSYNSVLKSAGISENIFSDIIEDKDKVIWIASGLNGGLIKLDKKSGSVTNYTNNPENNNSLSFNSVKSINIDSKGILWIGTHYGLNKFDSKKEEFTRYTEVDGISNNFIYGVLIDENDNPWVSTNYGISKFDVSNGKFINFNITDGIQGNEFNGFSYFKSQSGEMFFGGTDGLTSFYPKDLVEKTFIPMVMIDKISSAGEKIQLSSTIELKYNKNQIQLNFFMPDYRNTSKIQYAYKLEGLDEKWFFSDNRNYASYTNLEPGTYIFSVIGRNSSGEWSSPTNITIKVENPPWKTPIAYSLYFLIILSIIFLIWNRVKLLDSLVEQRTWELDNKFKENKELYDRLIRNEKYKNNYFVNLSHELRTPLNVILSTQQLIVKLNEDENNIPKDKLDYYMNTLKRNSNRLLNLINNIIDTSKIESGSYRLNMNKYDIVYLVEEAALSMKDFIENNGIELIIDPDVEEKIIECDNMEIEKCVINLIANATKFTPHGGKIEVKIFDLGDSVKISVKDTGVGIEPKYHKSIFNRFAQAYNNVSEEHGGSGLGLTLTNQLVKLHNGDIFVKSRLGEGSEFIIILPVKQKNI